jgi:hypothetical protein
MVHLVNTSDIRSRLSPAVSISITKINSKESLLNRANKISKRNTLDEQGLCLTPVSIMHTISDSKPLKRRVKFADVIAHY